jgi:hypothetical protein
MSVILVLNRIWPSCIHYFPNTPRIPSRDRIEEAIYYNLTRMVLRIFLVISQLGLWHAGHGVYKETFANTATRKQTSI